MKTSVISAALLIALVSASPLQALVKRQAQVVLELLKVIGVAINTDSNAWVSPSARGFFSFQIASLI